MAGSDPQIHLENIFLLRELLLTLILAIPALRQMYDSTNDIIWLFEKLLA
jgi:hypothetical protein